MYVSSIEYTVDQVGDYIPDFIPTDPELWFSIVEDIFDTNGVTAETSKFGYAIMALGSYMIEVRDLIVSPPPEPYSKLKAELPKRLCTTQKQDTRCLLEHESGNRKPSQLLRHLRTLCGIAVSEEAIRKQWMKRLPRQIQIILATQRNATLDNAAETADAIFDVLRSVTHLVETAREIQMPSAASTDVEALVARMTLGFREELTAIREELRHISSQNGPEQGRSNHRCGRTQARSQERRRHEQRGGKCFYHSKFGAKAEWCISPCSWVPQENWFIPDK